ncbi:MAG: thioredoxin domain-containing protein [Candidatus Woesearchaeota archaeon]|nr:thioredoxin domain-containing protein [Candidatus Woesearchaeota archaeon]
MDDDEVKGDPDAPVTLIEFSDYECPYCAKFALQTLLQIEEKYVKTGKVRLVFRDFPLGFHRNAQKAAEAAECAGEQGMYYEYHDKLFENQESLGIANFKTWAGELDLDIETFNECLDNGEQADEVKKDLQDGQIAGVSGTPAFFINGKFVSGAQPFEVFEQIIESELVK